MTMVHLLKRHKGYQCVLQASEEDCGAACSAQFASIMDGFEHHEKPGSRDWQLGTTLLGLKGCQTLGFNARSVKAHRR